MVQKLFFIQGTAKWHAKTSYEYS